MTLFVYILLCLLWGSTWLAIKVGLAEAPPFTTAAIRFLIATGVLWGISLVRGFKYPRDWRELMRIGYPGIFMYGMSYAMVYFGQQYVNSATSAVLFGAYPFFVAAFSWLRYRSEKLSRTAWVGMAVGFVGVMMISYDSLQTSGDLFLGTVLVVMAAAAAAYGVVIHKQNFSQHNIVVVANIQMIVGGVLLVAGALIFENWTELEVTPALVGSILYLAIPGTVVTFLGYYWLLKRTRVTVVSLIAFVSPMVAILVGLLIANESLTPLIVAGAVLILSGVLLVVRK